MPSTQDAAEVVGNPKMLRENLPRAIISVRAYLQVCNIHRDKVGRRKGADNRKSMPIEP